MPVSVTLPRSELAVLDDAAGGLTVGQCAMQRKESPETVKSQRKMVLAKLGARHMTHAVAIATREGMLALERAA